MTLKKLIALAVTGVAALAAATSAGAGTTQCTGTLGGTVDGNLNVPAGASCVLAGATVHGNVIVGSGASLHAVAGEDGMKTVIDGNVNGSDVAWVLLQYQTRLGGNFTVNGASSYATGFDIGVHVGGNATIVDNTGYTFVDAAIVDRNVLVQGATGGIEVEWNTVGGNESVTDNTPNHMSVYGNTVAGNIDVSRNTGNADKQIVDNTAARNLACVGNDDPLVTSGNAGKHVIGQC